MGPIKNPLDFVGGDQYISQGPSLSGSFSRGFASGAAIQEIQDAAARRQRDEAQRAAQFEREKQYRDAIIAYSQSPSQKAALDLARQFPDFHAQTSSLMKAENDVMDRANFQNALRISSAIENGSPETAEKLLEEQITLRQQSGMDPGVYADMYSAIKGGNYKGVQSFANMFASSVDPKGFETFVKSQGELRGASADLGKTQAETEALKAEAAKKSKETSLLDSRLALEKIEADSKRLSAQAAMLNAQMSANPDSPENQVKRAQIAKINQELGEKAAERDGKTIVGSTQLRNTIEFMKFFDTPQGKSGLDAATGYFNDKLPTTSENTLNAKAQLERLRAGEFSVFTNLVDLKGALSNTEGIKLQGVRSILAREDKDLSGGLVEKAVRDIAGLEYRSAKTAIEKGFIRPNTEAWNLATDAIAAYEAYESGKSKQTEKKIPKNNKFESIAPTVKPTQENMSIAPLPSSPQFTLREVGR